ncbi:MAG TPA: TonB-dependent receptor [Candidatus Solibacter sp.]|nr:TonB-dependent receptor [Candidatus Solibacter sp.]
MTFDRLSRNSRLRSQGWLFLLFAALLIAAPQTARAQAQAAINGTVRDASGAVIPDASVILHNNGTNLDRPTSTNSVGAYVLTDIQPGDYDLRVSKDGFTTSVQSDITLVVNQTATYDFILKTGSVKETVTVQATAAALETSTSELGVAIVRREVNDLPLNGRNFTQLLALTPGVVTINVSQNGSSGGVWSNPVGTFTYPSVNGQTNRSNLFMLDGVNNQGSFGSTYAVAPILDDIQEFKVQSHNDDASFGGSLGGLINVVTKSGTTQFHGSAWEFHRGASTDALPTFQPKGAPYQFSQNQFGAAGGGPIPLPGNGMSNPKTFFYAAYEGYRFTQVPPAVLYNTPNVPAELGGDLSSFPDQIYNPYSVHPDGSSPSGFTNAPFMCDGAGNPLPAPGNIQAAGIPCNKIPMTMINQSMVMYAQTVFPSPNLTGNPNFNGVDSTSTNTRQDTGTLRIDHQFSERDNLWARYAGFWQPVTGSGGFEGLTHTQKTNGFNVGVGYSHAFSNSSLLDATFGRVLLTINQGSNPAGVPPSFGTDIFNPNFAGNFRGGVEMVPIVAILGFIGNPNASAHNAAQVDYTKASDIWQFGGNYTKTYQRHTFRMGVNFQSNNANAVYLNSAVVFSAANTAAANSDTALTPNTGNALASFLLGVPNSGTRRNVVETEHGGWVDGAYFMDSWRATDKLTVNLGLRYDLTLVPIYGDNGHANNFVGDLDAKTGIYYISRNAPPCDPPAVAAPCIPGGVLPGGVSITPLNNGAIYHNDLKNFQPRIGLAYAVRDSTVIRAAYGRFYDNWAAITQTAQNFEGTWPSLDQLGASNLNAISGVPTVFATDPLSQGMSVPVTGPTPFNQTTWFADPYLKRPYADQWNLGIQQQFGTRTVLTANYVGSHGGRLDLGPYANTINPATRTQPLQYFDPTSATPTMPIPVTPTPFDYSGGRSHYNALQVSLDGKQWNGLTYLVSYTWSKSVDIGCTGWYGVEGCGIQNPYDVNADKGPSAIDIPQIFTAAWVYRLPFGSGQRFATNNKVVDYIIGGWALNGILTLTSGQPFDVGVGGDQALTLNFGCCNGYYDRLNLVKGVPVYVHHQDEWLNPDAFTIPAKAFGSFGDLGRNSLRADWFRNLDLSLFKEFPINERYRFEFRFEGFNIFNTPTWNPPDQNISDPTFNVISTTRSIARQLQFGVKFYF